MAISSSFTRPLATVTASETANLTAALTESGSTHIVDITTTVGANTKLIKRLKITYAYQGVNLVATVTEIDFAGSVANYVSATSPADNLGTTGVAYNLTAKDMDAFFTAGGDARS